jgi:hypothetical protein
MSKQRIFVFIFPIPMLDLNFVGALSKISGCSREEKNNALLNQTKAISGRLEDECEIVEWWARTRDFLQNSRAGSCVL